MWRGEFDNTRERSLATRKVGAMKLKMIAGEYRYAVAVRESQDLWLTLWVRRSPRGDVYMLVPRGDRHWNPHTSYHRDGTLHSKSFDRAAAVMNEMQTGTVYWNCCDRVSASLPWSGRKQSGFGATLSYQGIRAFVQPKAYHIRG